ncbi:hypothetical protein [Caudoviricetes sp.]|nr:hypothetical protein [Caudoviricetes sp.]
MAGLPYYVRREGARAWCPKSRTLTRTYPLSKDSGNP